MAKKSESSFSVTGLIAWLVGILVSLAVGSSMIDKTLTITFVPSIITIVAGWIVVIGALISVIMAIFGK